MDVHLGPLFCSAVFWLLLLLLHQATNNEQQKKVKTPNNNWFQFSCLLFCSVLLLAKTSAVFCRLRWPVYFFFYVVLLLLAHTCHSIAESAVHCLLSVTSTVCWPLLILQNCFLQFLVFQYVPLVYASKFFTTISFSNFSSLSSSFFLCFLCVVSRTHQLASASAHLLQRRWFLAPLYCRLAVAGVSFPDFSTNLPVGTTTTFTIPGLLPSAHYCGLRTLRSLLSTVPYAVCCTALLWMWFIGGPDRLTIIMFRRMLPVLSHKL